jgi:hypothetical protein
VEEIQLIHSLVRVYYYYQFKLLLILLKQRRSLGLDKPLTRPSTPLPAARPRPGSRSANVLLSTKKTIGRIARNQAADCKPDRLPIT